MKAILKNIILIIISLVLTHFLAVYFGHLYETFFPLPAHLQGSWIGTETSSAYFAGIIPAYIFFILVLLKGFGAGKKDWWAGILLLPAAAAMLYYDISHFWFYILVALIGWILGYGIHRGVKLLKKFDTLSSEKPSL